MVQIEIERTGQAPRRHTILPGATRIGRASDNDITIDEDMVSKRHLVVWCDTATSLRVRDLASKNGTVLNGTPLSGEADLGEGDTLVLGGVVQLRMVALEDRVLPASVRPGGVPPEAERALALVRGEAPSAAQEVEAVMADLDRRREALEWAMRRLRNLASAPSLPARYRYLVAEARRQLSDDAGAPTGGAHIWVLSFDRRPGRETPSFSALVHDFAAPVDVPSPEQFASSIVGRTVEARTSTWMDDAYSDERVRNAESVTRQRLRSVGCVPIGERAVLYISDPRERGAFGPGFRLRVEAICGLAGELEEPPEDLGLDDATVQGREILPGIVGRSQAMSDVARQVTAFARFRWNVLILGPPGTGKTAVARALHELSGVEGRFVHVNCATLTESLAVSELFGAVKGAYNDARDRPGYVGSASGGTLFLDEVGELPMDLQSKLLSLTRERTYNRVGEEETSRSFTGRIVAATNRGIASLRPDLAERLMECVVEMPPLSSRREDVPALAELFLEQLCEAEAGALDGRKFTFTQRALDLLASGSLEGNVARLKSRVQRGFMWAVIEGARQVRVDHLSENEGAEGEEAPPAEGDSFEEAVRRFKRQLLQQALERHGGNKTRTAEALGMTNRQQLIRQLKGIGLMSDGGDSG